MPAIGRKLISRKLRVTLIDTRIDQPISPIAEIEINPDSINMTLDKSREKDLETEATLREKIFQFTSKELVQECVLKSWPEQSRKTLERELKEALFEYNRRLKIFKKNKNQFHTEQVIPPNSNTDTSPLEIETTSVAGSESHFMQNQNLDDSLCENPNLTSLEKSCNCSCHQIYSALLSKWKLHEAYLEELNQSKLENEQNASILVHIAKGDQSNHQLDYIESKPCSVNSNKYPPPSPWYPLARCKEEWIQTRTRGYWNAKNIHSTSLFSNNGSFSLVNSYVPQVSAIHSPFGLLNFPPPPPPKKTRVGFFKKKSKPLQIQRDLHFSIIFPEENHNQSSVIENGNASGMRGVHSQYQNNPNTIVPKVACHWDSVDWSKMNQNYYQCSQYSYYSSRHSPSISDAEEHNNSEPDSFNIDLLSTFISDSPYHHVDIEFASTSRLLIELFTDSRSVLFSDYPNLYSQDSNATIINPGQRRPKHCRPEVTEGKISSVSLGPAITTKLSSKTNAASSDSTVTKIGVNGCTLNQMDVINPISGNNQNSPNSDSHDVYQYRVSQAQELKDPKSLNRLFISWPKKFSQASWLQHLADLKIFQSKKALSKSNFDSQFNSTRFTSPDGSKIPLSFSPSSSLHKSYSPPELKHICIIFEITAELASERVLGSKPWLTKSIPMTSLINRQNIREFSVGWSFLPLESIVPLNLSNLSKSQAIQARRKSLTSVTGIRKFDKSLKLNLAVFGGRPTHLRSTQCVPENPVFLTAGREPVSSSSYYAPKTVKENMLQRIGKFKEKPPHLVVSVTPLSESSTPEAFLLLGIPRPCVALESQLDFLSLFRKLAHFVFASKAKDPVLGEHIFDGQFMSRYQKIPLTLFSSTPLSNHCFLANDYRSHSFSWQSGIHNPIATFSDFESDSNSLQKSKFGIGSSKAHFIPENFSIPQRGLNPGRARGRIRSASSSEISSTPRTPQDFKNPKPISPQSAISRYFSVILASFPDLLEDSYFTNISCHLVQKFAQLKSLLWSPEDFFSNFLISPDIQSLSDSKKSRIPLDSRLHYEKSVVKNKGSSNSAFIDKWSNVLDISESQASLLLLIAGYWSSLSMDVAFLSNDQFTLGFPQKDKTLFGLWSKYRALCTQNPHLAESLFDPDTEQNYDHQMPPTKSKIDRLLRRFQLEINDDSGRIDFSSFSDRILGGLDPQEIQSSNKLTIRSEINHHSQFQSCPIQPRQITQILRNRFYLLSCNYILSTSQNPPSFNESNKRKKQSVTVSPVPNQHLLDVSPCSSVALHPSLALSRLFVPLHKTQAEVIANVHCHYQPIPIYNQENGQNNLPKVATSQTKSSEMTESPYTISDSKSHSHPGSNPLQKTQCPHCGSFNDSQSQDFTELTCFHCFHATKVSKQVLEFKKSQQFSSAQLSPSSYVDPSQSVSKHTQRIQVPVVLQTPFLYSTPFDTSETTIRPGLYFRFQESI